MAADTGRLDRNHGLRKSDPGDVEFWWGGRLGQRRLIDRWLGQRRLIDRWLDQRRLIDRWRGHGGQRERRDRERRSGFVRRDRERRSGYGRRSGWG
jgi:hypothetical protein